MMSRPFQIPMHLPRGPEHYWTMMCKAGSAGFTVGDIAGCTNGVAWSTVKDYVTRLAKEGHIKVIGARPAPGAARIHLYAVVKRSSQAPVLRRADYSGARGQVQLQLWTAMRSLGCFSIRELAVTASTEECAVKVRTAENYIRVLAKAGVVVIVEPYAKGRKGRAFASGAAAGTYRLKKSADTGPKPPKIFKSTIVFDANRQRVVSVAETEEASS